MFICCFLLSSLLMHRSLCPLYTITSAYISWKHLKSLKHGVNLRGVNKVSLKQNCSQKTKPSIQLLFLKQTDYPGAAVICTVTASFSRPFWTRYMDHRRWYFMCKQCVWRFCAGCVAGNLCFDSSLVSVYGFLQLKTDFRCAASNFQTFGSQCVCLLWSVWWRKMRKRERLYLQTWILHWHTTCLQAPASNCWPIFNEMNDVY